jgi:hypothetical protein
MGASPVVVALVAVAAGAVGYLVGGSTGTASSVEVDAQAEAERLRAEVASLKASMASRPTALAAAGTTGAPTPPVPAAGGAHPPSDARVAPAEAVPATAGTPTLSLEDAAGVDDLARRLVAYLEAQLARGTQGHLDLLRSFDEKTLEPALKRAVDSDADGARLVYPLLRFALQHEAQTADFVETTIRTMAEDPKALDGVDGEVLEAVVEGLAPALSAISAERVARVTGWAKQVIAAPKGSLPDSVERNRSDLERLLAAWAPPLGSAEAVEKLRDAASLSSEELRSLLRRVAPEDVAHLDLVSIVGPMLDRGEMRAISLLQLVTVPRDALPALDARARNALAKHPWIVRQYLHATGRTSWDDARPFVDEWIATGPEGRAVTSVLSTFQPPASYLADLLGRHVFDDATKAHLEAMRKGAEARTPPR